MTGTSAVLDQPAARTGPVSLEPADAARWASAALASGQPVTPFADHGWLTIAARLTGTHFVPLVVVADGTDVGVAPWLARRRGPVSTVNALPFPYLGPLVPPALVLPALAALRRRARRSGVLRFEFGFSPTTSLSGADLSTTGSDLRIDGTYLLDSSQGEEALLAGMSQSARKSIRKVERDGIEIRPATDSTTLDAVLRAAYGSRGLESGYAPGFPATPTELAGTGVDVRWTVAVQDDVEIAALLSVSTAEVAHVWLGGILPEHRSTRANVPLYWDAIRWAADRGVRTVDLVGIPDEGIGQFKKQFGGQVHPYARLTGSVPGLDRVQDLLRAGRQAIGR